MVDREKPKKKWYKRWWIWAIIIVVAAIIWAGTSGDGGDGETSHSKSDNSSASSIHKITDVNFNNTAGQQTTTVDKAEIKDVSNKNITDDNGDAIKYAIVIHMTVKNDATDTATSYPAQGHVVLPDGSQITGAESLSEDLDSAFKEGDIEKGAKSSGDVYFPIKDKQAKSIKKAVFKFEVLAGDENSTDKHYEVNLNFD